MKLHADLHVHTYFSDGRMSPAEVVAEAVKNGVQLISVTDHDGMAAYGQLPEICAEAGVRLVNGIEVSAYVGDVKIHTLGYNVNAEDTAFREFAAQLFGGAMERADDIVRKLNANGVAVTLQEVLDRRRSPLSPVHVMHIAFACADKGYCGGNAFNFFKEYLAFGKCAYSRTGRPSPEKAVEIITACGGFCSLAHPARIEMPREDTRALIARLKDCGLGGIEAVYTTHTVTETAYYKETAKTFGLEVTGGSDTHIMGGRQRIGYPEFYVDGVLAKKLKI